MLVADPATKDLSSKTIEIYTPTPTSSLTKQHPSITPEEEVQSSQPGHNDEASVDESPYDELSDLPGLSPICSDPSPRFTVGNDSRVVTDGLHSGKRQVERFTWRPRVPKRTFIAQEGFPDWLLCLRDCDWAEIGISEPQAARLRSECPNAFTHFGKKLKIIAGPAIMTYLNTIDILLLSGSSEFVENLSFHSSPSIPVIAVLTGISRNRRRSPNWKQWTYKHSKLGGVTACRVTIGFRGIDPIQLGSFVDRSLGHIIKHNERAKPSSPDVSGVYRESSLLQPNDLERMILYPTHMSYTGWGKRLFTESELSDAFDLPTWCEWNPSIGIPVKICLEVVQGFLAKHAPELPDPGAHSVKRAPISAPKHSWLPSLKCFLPGSWADPALISAKAAKADNAKVPVSMWNDRITLIFPEWTPHKLDRLRNIILRRQHRKLYLQFATHMRHRYGNEWITALLIMRRSTMSSSCSFSSPSVQERKRVKGGGRENFSSHPLFRDAKQGSEALSHYMNASWWEWRSGSTLFHWRWNSEEEKTMARDGVPVWIKSRLPTSRIKQRMPPGEVLEKLASKIDTVLERGYLELEGIKSHIDVFSVQKADDIRAVYNATKSGLNDAVWAPSFFLPTSRSALRVMSYCSYCVDMDLGEMFLNFVLDVRL